MEKLKEIKNGIPLGVSEGVWPYHNVYIGFLTYRNINEIISIVLSLNFQVWYYITVVTVDRRTKIQIEVFWAPKTKVFFHFRCWSFSLAMMVDSGSLLRNRWLNKRIDLRRQDFLNLTDIFDKAWQIEHACLFCLFPPNLIIMVVN